MYPAQAAARVTVHSSKGTFQAYVADPLGDPANPLGRAGVQDKFRRLAGPLLGPERAETIIAAAASLENGGLPALLGALAEPLVRQ